MKEILYPNFLEDYSQYQEVEAFWQDLFSGIVMENGWTWRMWMNPCFGDGSPFFDGNPIFNAYVPEVNRGLRILQIEPEDSDEFSFYEDVVELADETIFPELVISLILTEETKAKAEEAIRKWLVGEPLPMPVEKKIQG